jgi:tRNA G18 (ribose-2'-O)-methylase SpoU
MENLQFEIRLCQSCGLRYPLMESHSFGVRCPHCLGETVSVVHRELSGDRMLSERRKRSNLSVLLDNIRSAWNVGSILRSADGFGFDHAYLCGITPTPEQDAVRKTSLGAEDVVTWSYHKDAVKLVKGLKKEGWLVAGLEETDSARDISTWKRKRTRSTVLIAGSEVTGIDPELLDLCDEIYSIPMNGQKRSFNVAVAFGVAAYAMK